MRTNKLWPGIVPLLATAFLITSGARANDIPAAIEEYTAFKVNDPITLDGDLSEWPSAGVLENPGFFIPKGEGDAGELVTFEELSGVWETPEGGVSALEDHSANIQIVYDDENVYFGFVVTDDYHENIANSAWNGDSAQLHITDEERVATIALYNYALGGEEGFLAEEPIINHERGFGETEAIVTRDADTKKTTYEICMPMAALELDELTEGAKFGFGVAINDGDEDVNGQGGWSGYGPHSVVFGKSPEETALITLGPLCSDRRPTSDCALPAGQ